VRPLGELSLNILDVLIILRESMLLLWEVASAS
jgi:hypothetical protein